MRRSLVALAIALLVTSCTSSQRKDVGETAIRNSVAIAGAKEFKDRGYPIKGGLHCTAKATNSAGTQVTVSCTGLSTNGHSVTITGSTNNKSASSGDFVGSVDGKELFRKSCLGC